MKQLTLDPEEFVAQLPEGVQAAVKVLQGLQDKVGSPSTPRARAAAGGSHQ